MPADVALILASLTSFYDFTDRVVVHVGAGGGKLLGYAPWARRVLAVDKDAPALRGLGETVTVIAGDFGELDLRGDVVLFEFCLHEMRDPRAAIDRARSAAPDVVVIDHLPESPWAWYANEEASMARAWEAVASAGPRSRRSCEAVQRFEDYPGLQARLAALGEESHRRIRSLERLAPIEIPMPYALALL